MFFEEKCNLCKEPIIGVACVYSIGRWDFHYVCYRVVLKRLARLEDILLVPQDEFDEWVEWYDFYSPFSK